MSLRILALFLMCCACGPAGEDAASPAVSAYEPPPVPEGPVVGFLGDSICAGLHLSADEAFPAVLERRFQERGRPFRLINNGTSGRTTAGGLAAIDWLLTQNPAIVVVELGANDGLRGLPLETIEANLVAIVERILAADAVPLLLGARIPPSYGADYSSAFAALYPTVAERLGVALVPFFMEGVGGVPEMNLADGLHPTAEGQRVLADTVAPALEELLDGIE